MKPNAYQCFFLAPALLAERQEKLLPSSRPTAHRHELPTLPPLCGLQQPASVGCGLPARLFLPTSVSPCRAFPVPERYGLGVALGCWPPRFCTHNCPYLLLPNAYPWGCYRRAHNNRLPTKSTQDGKLGHEPPPATPTTTTLRGTRVGTVVCQTKFFQQHALTQSASTTSISPSPQPRKSCIFPETTSAASRLHHRPPTPSHPMGCLSERGRPRRHLRHGRQVMRVPRHQVRARRCRWASVRCTDCEEEVVLVRGVERAQAPGRARRGRLQRLAPEVQEEGAGARAGLLAP